MNKSHNANIDILKGLACLCVVYIHSTNIFTLEWYWEDDDKLDTAVGSEKDTQYYKLNLQIQPVEL